MISPSRNDNYATIEKKETMITKGKPVIQDNGQGGCIHVTPNGYSANVLQISIECKDGVITEIRDEATLFTDDIPTMFRKEIVPGRTLSGEIVEVVQFSPIDNDDPLLCMSILEDGTAEKIDGKYVWRFKTYQEPENL